MDHFLSFFVGDSKKLVTVCTKCLSSPERSDWVLSVNGVCVLSVNGLWN